MGRRRPQARGRRSHCVVFHTCVVFSLQKIHFRNCLQKASRKGFLCGALLEVDLSNALLEVALPTNLLDNIDSKIGFSSKCLITSTRSAGFIFLEKYTLLLTGHESQSAKLEMRLVEHDKRRSIGEHCARCPTNELTFLNNRSSFMVENSPVTGDHPDEIRR